MIRRPAFILALLTGLNFVNYVDRTVLAAVLSRVQTDLSLSETQGGLLATAFLVGYFAMSPVFGWLGDRATDSPDAPWMIWQTRRGLMTVGVLIWSAATYSSGHAHTFWEMMAARAVVGVGEASYAAVAPTIIDDLAPADRKGKWLSVFYLAIPVGSALGYLLGGFIQKHWDWRVAFYVAGGPGALFALLCLFIKEPARVLSKRKKEGPLQMLVPLLKERIYVRAVLGYCFFTFALGGFAHWAPKYIHAHYGTKLDQANYAFGLILVAAGAIGTGVGGWWGDQAAKKAESQASLETKNRAGALGHLRVCAIASALGAPFALACLLAPTSTGFFVMIFVCEAALFLSTSPINAALLMSVPAGIRTSAMAVSIFAIHLLGDLWSPPLVGVIADQSSMQHAMLLLPLAILLSSVVWWIRAEPGSSRSDGTSAMRRGRHQTGTVGPSAETSSLE